MYSGLLDLSRIIQMSDNTERFVNVHKSHNKIVIKSFWQCNVVRVFRFNQLLNPLEFRSTAFTISDYSRFRTLAVKISKKIKLS